MLLHINVPSIKLFILMLEQLLLLLLMLLLLLLLLLFASRRSLVYLAMLEVVGTNTKGFAAFGTNIWFFSSVQGTVNLNKENIKCYHLN